MGCEFDFASDAQLFLRGSAWTIGVRWDYDLGFRTWLGVRDDFRNWL